MSTTYRLRDAVRPQNGDPLDTTRGLICNHLAETREYLTAKDIEMELHISTPQRKRALKALQEDDIVVKHNHPEDGRKVLYGLRGFRTERPPEVENL